MKGRALALGAALLDIYLLVGGLGLTQGVKPV